MIFKNLEIKKNIFKGKLNLALFVLFAIALPTYVILITGNSIGHPSTDWDLHAMYAAISRISILNYHQFPLWNPYHCGGMSLIGNPQARFLSPLFLLHLFFQTEFALKLESVCHILISICSFWFLAGALGFNNKAKMAGALVYALNGSILLRIAGAHFTFLSFSFVPLLFVCLLKSLETRDRRKWIILGAFVLALIGLDGLTYPFVLSILSCSIFSLAISISKKAFSPIAVLLSMCLLSCLLLAPKLIPVIENISHFDRANASTDSLPFSFLYHSFLSRDQHFSIPFSREVWIPWHLTAGWWGEYGAYIGLPSFCLMLIGFLRLKKLPYHAPFLFAFLCLLVLWFGNFASWAPWTLLRKIPPFNTQEFPSRMAHPLMLYISIFTSLGMQGLLDWIVRRGFSQRYVILLLTLIALDLSYVGLFPIKNLPFFPNGQRIESKDFYQIYSSRGKSTYAAYLNLGTINCYESLFPSGSTTSVRGLNESEYRGEFWSADLTGLKLKFWSPNQLAFDWSKADKNTVLTINQNYYPGWNADHEPLIDQGGLLAVPIQKEKSTVTARYSPLSFKLGLMLFCLAASICLFLKRFRIFTASLILSFACFGLTCYIVLSNQSAFIPYLPLKRPNPSLSILYATLAALDSTQNDPSVGEQYLRQIKQWPGSDAKELDAIWSNVRANMLHRSQSTPPHDPAE